MFSELDPEKVEAIDIQNVNLGNSVEDRKGLKSKIKSFKKSCLNILRRPKKSITGAHRGGLLEI